MYFVNEKYLDCRKWIVGKGSRIWMHTYSRHDFGLAFFSPVCDLRVDLVA